MAFLRFGHLWYGTPLMEAIAIDRSPRRLGASALHAFRIAYGCWRFAGTEVATATRKIETALDTGIDLFDHADIYGEDGAAESLFGEALAANPGLRQRMLIATKCGIVPGIPYDSSAAHIQRAAEASLRRLRTDVIDIYQIHRPDLLAHPHDVAAALTALREQGKIREVGVSNFHPARFEALQAHLSFPIVTNQPELSPWFLEPFENGIIDQCMRHDVTPLAWSPFAGGRLGLSIDEARATDEGDRLVAVLGVLDDVAARSSVDRAAVALAFLLAHPSGVIPIIGTQREERIRSAVQAFDVALTRADWYRIYEAALGSPLP